MKKWVKVLSFIVFIQVPEQSNAFFDDFNYGSDYYETIAYENTTKGPSFDENNIEPALGKEDSINSVKDNQNKKIIITTGPLELLKGLYTVNFDFKISGSNALGLHTSFFNKSLIDNGDSKNILGQTIGLRHHYFFNGQTFENGSFILTQLGITRFDYTTLNSLKGITIDNKKEVLKNIAQSSKNTVGLYSKIGLGYGWSLNRFNVRIIGGAQYFSHEIKGLKEWYLPKKGFTPWGSLSIGFSL
jgi:hypothetical protein